MIRGEIRGREEETIYKYITTGDLPGMGGGEKGK